MQEFTIRPATPADEAALGRYGAALMRQHHALDPERFILTERPEAGYGRFLVSEVGDPDSVVLVAERAGEIVGYIYAACEPMSWKELRAACGYVHDVFIDEGVRHQGVARLLMRAMIEWAKGKGLPRLVLSSAAGNASAQRLFESLGFRRTMIEMTRELNAPD
jgi:GNAT superfamily N-acetyltransferase